MLKSNRRTSKKSFSQEKTKRTICESEKIALNRDISRPITAEIKFSGKRGIHGDISHIIPQKKNTKRQFKKGIKVRKITDDFLQHLYKTQKQIRPVDTENFVLIQQTNNTFWIVMIPPKYIDSLERKENMRSY